MKVTFFRRTERVVRRGWLWRRVEIIDVPDQCGLKNTSRHGSGRTLSLIAHHRAFRQRVSRVRKTARRSGRTVGSKKLGYHFMPEEGCVLDTIEAFGRDRYQPIGRASAVSEPSAGSDLRRPPSRLAALVELTESLHPSRSTLASVLLAACLDQGHGRAVLRPLWVEEAMHRAHVFVRLLALEHAHWDTADRTPLEKAIESVLARDLASLIKSLETTNEMAILPCARVLRDIVRDIDALFGTVAGEVTLYTDIASVALPAYKRRALVLAAVELVANALLHGFRGRSGGRIEVTLKLLGARASLRVTDDGVGFTAHPPALHFGIAATLADLLEGELAYDRICGRTTAAIVFPA